MSVRRMYAVFCDHAECDDAVSVEMTRADAILSASRDGWVEVRRRWYCRLHDPRALLNQLAQEGADG